MGIGRLIKVERKKKNIKQEWLADGICSPSYLSKIENGQTMPSESILQSLLNRLDISIAKEDFKKSTKIPEDFSNRFQEAISKRDKKLAQSLQTAITNFLKNHPLNSQTVYLQLMKIRLMLMNKKCIAEATESLSQVEAIRSDLTDHQLIHLYMIEGILSYRENRYQNAIHVLKKAYRLTTECRLSDWEKAELHYLLSLAAISDYRYVLAINHVQEALNYYNSRVLGNRSIDCLIILGIAKKNMGNVHQAIETFRKAQQIMQHTRDNESFGIIEHNLGVSYSLLKNHERSFKHFNNSLNAKPNPEEKIITIFSLLNAHKKNGDKKLAKSWLHEGLTLIHQLDYYDQSLYKHHFSIYKALLYDEEALISTFESALKYFESKQNYHQCFLYCNVLAQKVAEKNHFKLATTYYEKAFNFHLKHRNLKHWEELT